MLSDNNSENNNDKNDHNKNKTEILMIPIKTLKTTKIMLDAIIFYIIVQ